MPRSAARTRQRILEAAYRLFYRQGFLRSGVDAVATAAGVTKRTLYNHFPSKDALIAAVLAERAGMAEAEVRRWSGTDRPDPETLVRDLFAGLRRWAAMPEWRGSGFTRAAMELAWAPGHPARHVAAAHKRTIEGLLTAAFAEGGAADPAYSARQSALLIEGAMALRLIHGDDAYLDAAEAAALALVAAAL
ncbi:MAG: TetR/AcrR family transcriptional regulator [Alphaproteobacteria bacterium]